MRGLRETVRALNNIDRSLTSTVRRALKEAAVPVSADARLRIGVYRGASISTIAPRVGRGMSVFVTQRARKVTGQRSDFGALQMTRGLIPAVSENTELVLRGVTKALDDLAVKQGF